MDWKRW